MLRCSVAVWNISVGQNRRIAKLDALRGIAVCVVPLQHVLEEVIGKGALPPWLDQCAALIFADGMNWGRFGAAIFFLISGCVIPFSFRGERPLLGFAVSRFFRLYRAYWMSLMLALIILWVTGRSMPSTGAALANVTLLQTFVRVPDVVHVYWTPALEILFYFATAVLFRFRLHSNSLVITGAIGICIVASLILALLSLCSKRHLPANLPLNPSLMFAGTLVRLAWRNGDTRAGMLMPYAFGLLIAAIPIVQWSAYCDSIAPYVQPLPLTAAYLLAIVVLLFALRWSWEFGPIWLWLGAISYSVYLVHGPWLQAMVTLFGPPSRLTVASFIVANALLTVGSATLIYQLLEKMLVRSGHRQMARISSGQREASSHRDQNLDLLASSESRAVLCT